jgi:hypothetical protein
MLEVLQYLRANNYKTYIVTGGGQDWRVGCAAQDLAWFNWLYPINF